MGIDQRGLAKRVLLLQWMVLHTLWWLLILLFNQYRVVATTIRLEKEILLRLVMEFRLLSLVEAPHGMGVNYFSLTVSRWA